ncbi:transposase [Candidatus Dependentiae bacterium]|nr:transposase [Candidatus Dependentiae bacterium]
MARIYKKHSSKFKAKVAIEAIKEQKTLGELSKEHSVAPTQISTWKKQIEEKANSLFEGKQEKDHQEEIDKLHRIIGQITAERDFLERVLDH